MAVTLETLQTRREELQEARDSGTLVIRHGDEQVTFRSLEEINKTLAALDAQIAGLNGAPRRRIRYAYQSGKGL